MNTPARKGKKNLALPEKFSKARKTKYKKPLLGFNGKRALQFFQTL